VERTSPEIRRIITLSSGESRGSNLLAIYRFFAEQKLPLKLDTAVFTSANAPAIERCITAGIAYKVISAKDMRAFERELKELVAERGIKLIALCGFMKLLSSDFIQSVGIPVLNIHPALLPAYGGKGMYGMQVHEAVKAAGESISGATVHYVNECYDEGQILAQKRVDISDCQEAGEIAAKVLKIEHTLYPETIAKLLGTLPLRVAIATLGCKTNFYESAAIVEQFAGATLVDFNEPADIYIINSCTVTGRSDFKSRNLLRKALDAKALNPMTKVVITGCYAQLNPEEAKALGEVDLVVDNQHKLRIAQILAGARYQWQEIDSAVDYDYLPVQNMLGHSRAFQKIQDGCAYSCAYCAVHLARGPSRSQRFADVISQARLFSTQGFKEIVLGGVNLGLYRAGERDVANVVQALSEIEELRLIRLSSLEPQLLAGGLLERLQGISKLCPHFHIPLQSGSDTILQSMGRHYDTKLIQELVAQIMQLFPFAALGFDVITGFPGESEAHFTETYQLLEALPFSYLHVFSYSRRKDTPAYNMKDQVSKIEKNRRTNLLRALSARKLREYETKLRAAKTLLRGIAEADSEILSDHYLRIKLPYPVAQGDYIEIELSPEISCLY